MQDLTRQITNALQQYTDEVNAEIERIQNEKSKEAVKELKKKSPDRTGEYARGWRRKKMKGGYVIHNPSRYQLTHLLEKGHKGRDGSSVRAIKHISKVDAEIIQKKYVKEVERALKS